MQKLMIAIAAATILWSCDYSTSSNGNIDAAFAKEEKPSESHGHEGDAHGHEPAGAHPHNDATDHVESHASQDGAGHLVVPTDTSENDHSNH